MRRLGCRLWRSSDAPATGSNWLADSVALAARPRRPLSRRSGAVHSAFLPTCGYPFGAMGRRRFRRSAQALMLCLACTLLAGCGGSAPRRDSVQEALVISDANAYCRHISMLPPVSRRSQQQIRTIQARLADVQRAISKTAAYLPAGRDLNEAHAARRALYAEESRGTKAGLGTDLAALNRRFDLLQLRIYHDEIALGLTCNGEIARAAHERVHALAQRTR
jgi:hypothetical protein